VGRADEAAAAALDAVEEVVFLGLAEVLRAGEPVHLEGARSAGQALAHSPQRMHGISGGGGGKRAGLPTRMQLVALTTGTSKAGMRTPIIGPPMM
jgi:hypothetical protein